MIVTIITIVVSFLMVRLTSEFAYWANCRWGRQSKSEVIRWHSTAPYRGYKPSRPTEIYPMRDKCELCGREDDNSDEHEVHNISISYKRILWGTHDVEDGAAVRICAECQKNTIQLLTSENKKIRIVGQAIVERTIVTRNR